MTKRSRFLLSFWVECKKGLCALLPYKNTEMHMVDEGGLRKRSSVM